VTALRALLATLLVAAGSLFLAAPAPAAAPPTITLVAQDLVVAPGGVASFAFSVGGTVPDNTEVVVEAYTKFGAARSDLASMLAGQLRNRDVGFVATSLDLLPPDALGRRTISLPTVLTPQERVQGGNALLPDAGMYPVTIELRADNEPLAQLVSAVVRLDGAAAPAPLDVALVVPIDGGPTLRADGTTMIDDADRTRLQTVTGVLAASATPLTVVPRPELIDGLSRTGLPADTEQRSALAAAIGARQVLATPYVEMDPTALGRAGLGSELTQQLAAGEDTLATALPGITTDRTTWVAGGRAGPDGITMVRELGARRLVLPAEALDPAPGADGVPTTSVEVHASGETLPVEVAVSDPGFAAAFAPGPDPVLRAYQFVAQLLAVGVDHPSTAAHQGVVIVPPRDWQPDPTFLATVVALLGQNPLLHPVTLDQWFREVAGPTDGPRALAPADPADLSSFATGLTLTRLRLSALSSMLPAADPLPAAMAARLRVAVDGSLDATQRQAYLDAANGQLNELADAVDPVATRRITLASRSTEVPITLHRRIDRPIKVRVHLESPKLSFPDNDILVTLDAETVQQRITVKARANGTFPLMVSIMTPEGDVAVAPPTELTVHATTLSGFGVVLTVGALLVLATWWVRHLRRNRRMKAMARGAQHHPSVGQAPA
jgi:Family of unknown function (DUF6049)